MTRQRAPWKGREWSPRRRAEGYAQAWGAGGGRRPAGSLLLENLPDQRLLPAGLHLALKRVPVEEHQAWHPGPGARVRLSWGWGERLHRGPLLRCPRLEPLPFPRSHSRGCPQRVAAGLGCWRWSSRKIPQGRPECQRPTPWPGHTCGQGQGLWVSGAGAQVPSLGVTLSGGARGHDPAWAPASPEPGPLCRAKGGCVASRAESI